MKEGGVIGHTPIETSDFGEINKIALAQFIQVRQCGRHGNKMDARRMRCDVMCGRRDDPGPGWRGVCMR